MQFDPAKDAANIVKHGVSLARAEELVIEKSMVDGRRDYGEVRYLAYGMLDGLPHVLAFTVRDGEVRPISFRRAHLKEYQRNVP